MIVLPVAMLSSCVDAVSDDGVGGKLNSSGSSVRMQSDGNSGTVGPFRVKNAIFSL